MKSKILALFFIFFQLSSSEIKICELNSISVDILGAKESYEYTIYNQTKNNITITLNKLIIKEETELKSENYIYVTKNSTKNSFIVPFENIDGFYLDILGSEILICPKGNYHPYNLILGKYIEPNGFQIRGKWDLKCYLHDTGYFLFFYLMNENKNFYYSLNKVDILEYNGCFYNKLFDFRLENGNYEHNYKYKFPVINYESNNIYLQGRILNLNAQDNQVNSNTIHGVKYIISLKSNTQAYFDDNNYFYYFTYNNASDFESGYSTTNFDLNGDYSVNSITLYQNKESPFLCLEKDNYSIEEINFIQKTKYVYYIIYNIKEQNYCLIFLYSLRNKN